MNKREYCLNHPSIAYYSGLFGIEIKGIEYGIEDYIYSVSGTWNGKPSYHRNKIMYTASGDPYFRIYGYRIPLNECIRMNF